MASIQNIINEFAEMKTEMMILSLELEACRLGLEKSFQFCKQYFYLDEIVVWIKTGKGYEWDHNTQTSITVKIGYGPHRPKEGVIIWDMSCGLDGIIEREASPKDFVLFLSKHYNLVKSDPYAIV